MTARRAGRPAPQSETAGTDGLPPGATDAPIVAPSVVGWERVKGK